MTPARSEHHEETTYQWLVRALGGAVPGPTSPMLARPSADEPNLLLPTATTAGTVAALRRSHDDRSTRSRLASTIGRAVGRAGLIGTTGGERIDLPLTSAVRSIQQLFGDPDLQVAIGAGPPRRNRKPVLMLIRPDGEIAGFAKVGWSPFTIDLVQNEFRILQMVDGRLPRPMQTPAPIALIERDDHVISVTGAIPGSDWARRRALVPEQIDSIGRSVGNRICAIDDLAWLTEPRFGAQEDASEQRLEEAVAQVALRFGDQKLEVGLWHGDLNPWNLVSGRHGIGLLDWEFGGLDRPLDQDRRHLRLEAIRRDPDVTPEEALKRFVEIELGGPSTEAELGVYLADIAIRESRLSGQGWSGAMSGYRDPLSDAIEGLLR